MIVGVGTDIVEVPRIADMWREHRDAFMRRAFTAAEVAYCESRPNPAQHLAARFAAKEAALKALGTGWGQGAGLSEIEVVRAEDGRPSLVLHGAAGEHAARLGVTKMHVSCSHTDEYACAVVVMEQ